MERESMATADSRAFQIVLAEDNPADVTLVRMALQDAGLAYALRVIEDGEQALSFTPRDTDRNLI
jgi:CheY-like chemotaxis protein